MWGPPRVGPGVGRLVWSRGWFGLAAFCPYWVPSQSLLVDGSARDRQAVRLRREGHLRDMPTPSRTRLEGHLRDVQSGSTDDRWSLFSSRRWLAGRFAWIGGCSVGNLCSVGDLLCAASNPRCAGKPGSAGPRCAGRARSARPLSRRRVGDMADAAKGPFRTLSVRYAPFEASPVSRKMRLSRHRRCHTSDVGGHRDTERPYAHPSNTANRTTCPIHHTCTTIPITRTLWPGAARPAPA